MQMGRDTLQTLRLAIRQRPWISFGPLLFWAAFLGWGMWLENGDQAKPALKAETAFEVYAAPQEAEPNMGALIAWLSTAENKQALLESLAQAHPELEQHPPQFELTFAQPSPSFQSHKILCKVSLLPQDEANGALKTSASHSQAMATQLSREGCALAQASYRKLFSTHPRFNQEYAFHRLHIIEQKLSETLVSLEAFEKTGILDSGELKTVQSLQNSVYYRTMVAVNSNQKQFLGDRYRSLLGRVKDTLPISGANLSPQAIGNVLQQNSRILQLEKQYSLSAQTLRDLKTRFGEADPQAQKAMQDVQTAQNKLAQALEKMPNWARQPVAQDESGVVPVRWSGTPSVPLEQPAVQQNNGTPQPSHALQDGVLKDGIQFRALSRREIHLLEDLSHLTVNLSQTRQAGARFKSQGAQATRQLMDLMAQREKLDTLLDKQSFLERNYDTWSELASRQAILATMQEENSTSDLSRTVVQYVAPRSLQNELDWDFLLEPGVIAALFAACLMLGLGVAMLVEHFSVEARIEHLGDRAPEKPTLEKEAKHSPFKKSTRKLEPAQVLGKPANPQPAMPPPEKPKPGPMKPKQFKHGAKPETPKQTEGPSWLRKWMPKAGSSPPTLASLETMTLSLDCLESPQLFLATVQDPDSLLSQRLQNARQEMAQRFAPGAVMAISGNSLVAAGLAVQYAQSGENTCLLEVSDDAALIGYLFQMNGPEGLSDLFMEHLKATDLLKCIGPESGVAHLSVLPRGLEAIPYPKQMSTWRGLVPVLQQKFSRIILAMPTLTQSKDLIRILEALSPDWMLWEAPLSPGISDEENQAYKQLMKAVPLIRVVRLQE